MSAIDHTRVRTWNEVAVGDEFVGFELHLGWTTMVQQVDGSQDWNRQHHDHEFAVDSGVDEVFYNTGWTAGLLGRLLTDWMGRDGWVESMGFQMRAMNTNGDVVRSRGRVTGLRIEQGRHLVDLEIALENDRVGVTTPGTATVRLPHSRSRTAGVDA